MSGRIVVFGATGYTGRLVIDELVQRGVRPVIAGRDAGRLAQLGDELGGGLETCVADVEQPRSIAALVDEGDVLVSTVGPFVRWGQPAVLAAVAKRAAYLDSSGESTFIRDMRERVGQRAVDAGTPLIPAFGYDYVPGNLAGALALRRAGPDSSRLDVGYFAPGMGGVSGGTVASSVGMMLMPSFRFDDGRLVDDRLGARTRTFRVGADAVVTVAVGGTEHLFLPALAPGLRAVGVYLGWFGPLARFAPQAAAVARGVTAVPGAASLLSSAAARFRGSAGGPDADARARGASLVVAEVSDADGRTLARVELTGPSPYTLTGRLLAWAATTALAGAVHGSGVLGPVQAFGLDELESGCATLGLTEVSTGG